MYAKHLTYDSYSSYSTIYYNYLEQNTTIFDVNLFYLISLFTLYTLSYCIILTFINFSILALMLKF
jgi:hypothetical protein